MSYLVSALVGVVALGLFVRDWYGGRQLRRWRQAIGPVQEVGAGVCCPACDSADSLALADGHYACGGCGFEWGPAVLEPALERRAAELEGLPAARRHAEAIHAVQLAAEILGVRDDFEVLGLGAATAPDLESRIVAKKVFHQADQDRARRRLLRREEARASLVDAALLIRVAPMGPATCNADLRREITRLEALLR